MLYSAEKGNNTSFRGRVWQLTNRQWRACNYNGQQCNFKLYNEALRFSLKGKPINEDVDETYDDTHRTGKYIKEGRSRTYYKPELKGSQMRKLAAGLISQGYKADVKGPNLSTDAPEAVVDAVHGYATSEGVDEGPQQPGRRVSGKAPKSMPDRSAFDAIKPGSRVSMRTPQGQVVKGKAVMYNRQHDSWVLNMGGRHGTPGVVSRDNFVGLGGGGGKMNRLSDRPRTEGGAGSGPQKGGEEKSYKAWRTAADQPDSDDRKLRRLKKNYDREKTRKYEGGPGSGPQTGGGKKTPISPAHEKALTQFGLKRQKGGDSDYSEWVLPGGRGGRTGDVSVTFTSPWDESDTSGPDWQIDWEHGPTQQGKGMKGFAKTLKKTVAQQMEETNRINEDARTAGSLRKQLRAGQFKHAKQVPAGLKKYVNASLADVWIRGNVVVLTNGILWHAYTDDGGSIGGGTDRDQIMTTIDRSSWTNF